MRSSIIENAPKTSPKMPTIRPHSAILLKNPSVLEDIRAHIIATAPSESAAAYIGASGMDAIAATSEIIDQIRLGFFDFKV